MILKIRAGALPLAVLFENSSHRPNNVRLGLVIKTGRDLGQVLVFGFICGRRLYHQIWLPPWVPGQWGMVEIEENNLFSPGFRVTFVAPAHSRDTRIFQQQDCQDEQKVPLIVKEVCVPKSGRRHEEAEMLERLHSSGQNGPLRGCLRAVESGPCPTARTSQWRRSSQKTQLSMICGSTRALFSWCAAAAMVDKNGPETGAEANSATALGGVARIHCHW
jgi:hypothetical protein